jgi:hypothetical protein
MPLDLTCDNALDISFMEIVPTCRPISGLRALGTPTGPLPQEAYAWVLPTLLFVRVVVVHSPELARNAPSDSESLKTFSLGLSLSPSTQTAAPRSPTPSPLKAIIPLHCTQSPPLLTFASWVPLILALLAFVLALVCYSLQDLVFELPWADGGANVRGRGGLHQPGKLHALQDRRGFRGGHERKSGDCFLAFGANKRPRLKGGTGDEPTDGALRWRWRQVPGVFYVNQALEEIVFDELRQHVTAGGYGGFLPAVKQVRLLVLRPLVVVMVAVVVVVENLDERASRR